MPQRPRGRFVTASLAGTVTSVLRSSCAGRTVEIRLVQSRRASLFRPAGVHIVWAIRCAGVQVSGFHSITAYHPKNDNHELRIPQAARPWDSDILLAQSPRPDATFEHVFTVAGVYDYFCKPHELAGMVGRIVVGEPGDGPGTKPFGYAPDARWKPVPEVARKALPSIAEIVQKGKVRTR